MSTLGDKLSKRGDLEKKWTLQGPYSGAWMIKDVDGGFIETCYNDEIAHRIVEDHNVRLELEKVSKALNEHNRKRKNDAG